MKCKTKIILIALFLSTLIIFVSCQKQKAEWKGTIEEENGVTVIMNPKEPIYEEDIFQLNEELIIGKRGVREYVFSYISMLEVNDKGDIYVLDYKYNNVKIFDNNGQYVKTFGRSGQGPGEIERPSDLIMSKQDEIVLVDINGISFFSLGGKFIKEIPQSNLRNRIKMCRADRNGNIYAYLGISNDLNPRYELQKLDSQFNFIKSIESSPLQNVRKNGYNPFYPYLIYDITHDGHIICGHNEKYEIRIYDSHCILKMKILKEYDPLKISQEDIGEYLAGFPPQTIKEMNLSTYFPPFQFLVSDDEGRIYVMTYERTEGRNGTYYDVFSHEGKCLAKVAIPSKKIPIFKNNKLYTIEEDEDGYQYVKRYKVTWKY